MSKQKEGSLQERIQKIITKRGGYCFKNHGDMTTEPGRPDIICCYKGLFVAIEAKVDNNAPSKAQGIHCRKIWKAEGIAIITWDVSSVEEVLDFIDNISPTSYDSDERLYSIKRYLTKRHIDDGTRW